MRGKQLTIILGVTALLVAGCGSTETATKPETSTEVASAPATTTPPGGRMNALFCQLTTLDGAYYVQILNPTMPPGMCTAAVKDYTQEEFSDIPGLKRQCIFDRDTDIKQKHGMVSIYSDETPGSIAAAKTICSNAGY
jgi:uncharacterized protein YceK